MVKGCEECGVGSCDGQALVANEDGHCCREEKCKCGEQRGGEKLKAETHHSFQKPFSDLSICADPAVCSPCLLADQGGAWRCGSHC